MIQKTVHTSNHTGLRLSILALRKIDTQEKLITQRIEMEVVLTTSILAMSVYIIVQIISLWRGITIKKLFEDFL